MYHQNEPSYGHHGEHHGGRHGDCGCGYHGHHASREQWRRHGDCGCGLRRFPTREEIIGGLEEYLKQLQAEAKGVEERIVELRKEQT